MKGFNCVNIGGFLTRDPELRYTTKATPVCTFGLAVNGRDPEAGGAPTTLFIDIVTWNRQAESCAKYLKKGRLVVVEGRLACREWLDQHQTKKFHYEVIAHAVHFLEHPDGARVEG